MLFRSINVGGEWSGEFNNQQCSAGVELHVSKGVHRTPVRKQNLGKIVIFRHVCTSEKMSFPSWCTSRHPGAISSSFPIATVYISD